MNLSQQAEADNAMLVEDDVTGFATAIIIGEEERKPPTPLKRVELLKEALKAKAGTLEELNKLSDADLASLVEKGK